MRQSSSELMRSLLEERSGKTRAACSSSFVTETTAPGAPREGARRSLPAELVGSQTTWSAISVTSDRDGDGRVAAAHGDARRRRRHRARRRSSRDPGAGPGRGAGEERLAVLQRPAVEQVAPGGEHERAGLDARDVAGLDGRDGVRGALSTGRGRISARTSRSVRVPRNSPISSASMSSDAVVADLGGLRAASKVRTRPSQSTKVPAFSACAATGSTTSATAVTADGRISSETTNGRVEGVGGTGDAEVGGVDAADDERAELTGCGCGDDAGGVAAGRRRAVRRRPRPRRPRRGPRHRVTGRPPGSRVGRAPASSAPRSPARRGTHARRAPVASARAAAALSAPGTVARRSPTRITASSRRPSARGGDDVGARSPRRGRAAPRAPCPARSG